jgi:hypothetical protein
MSERMLVSDRHYPRLAPTEPAAAPVAPAPPAPPEKKTEWIVPVALGSIAAVFVLIVAVGAAVGTNSAAGRAGAAVAKAAAKGGRSALNAGTVTAGQSAPTSQVPTSVAPSPSAQTVTFSCSGKAPDGIEITYGPDGSSLGASELPFSRTLPLDVNAMYYVVQAQLQGSGTVSCTTVVHYNDASGMARSVTKTGAASRGFNIADAQVCSGFDVDWETC